MLYCTHIGQDKIPGKIAAESTRNIPSNYNLLVEKTHCRIALEERHAKKKKPAKNKSNAIRIRAAVTVYSSVLRANYLY